ncbi:MAG: polysaccharide lyase [Planctomycetota bacterium]|nr:MAG: polysaccharide lyase [Planctomycetota bacterium]REJ95536.1 MAG: polysaccharide lyase [Planctomycetota bacterium]REK21922.1 MAG: polysaccharide lyase [Planctomycetota bacterium]REK32166.1 MAG: polysaccharide lyase [Planctomycetota bacterium]
MLIRRSRVRATVVALLLLASATESRADDAPDRRDAIRALHRSTAFFRNECAAGGGYVYRWSGDLTKREGEGRVDEMTAWLQPPGTPSVGEAYLDAYELTGSKELLDAAVETAMALVNGQLESGGWDNHITFDPQERMRYAYRVDRRESPDRLRNTTTFDDDKSQSAIRFLVRLDEALEFKNRALHESAQFALNAVLESQYPNGAWPQRYSEFPDPDEFPVMAAAYPESWPRSWPDEDYREYYTLNDNTIRDLIVTLLDAYDVYGDQRYLDAAMKGGDFFLLAQMPDPQPGWAQQYNREMHPAWARKFEPASITGGESQGVMRALLLLYRRTGQDKYLTPIPKALDYYRASLREDGRLARFYELHTNRPLYFTRDYTLTYDDGDMPTHYGFIVGSQLDRIEAEYGRLVADGPDRRDKPARRRPRMTAQLRKQASAVIHALDARGAWVEPGRLRYHGDDDPTREVIESQTFIRNILTLAEFVAASE